MQWLQVDALSSVRVYVPKDLRTPDARRTAVAALAEVVAKRFSGAPPLLEPEEDMSISDGSFRKAQRRLESVEGLLSGHTLAKAADLRPRLIALQRKHVSANSKAVCGSCCSPERIFKGLS